MSESIIIRGHRYLYFDSYDEWKDAYNTARYHQRTTGTQYYILKTINNWGDVVFKLYMTKVGRLW